MPDLTEIKKMAMLRYGLLVLLAASVYATTINHGFVWDDNNIIVQNPLLEKLGNIPRIFLSEDTAMGFTGYYRPVTYLSFAMDRAIWGMNPAGFHLTNLILHVVAVLLYHSVITALFKDERLAFAASLIFALHPVAGETVNFLAGGRNTLLAACFALLSLLCYLKNKLVPAVASFTIAIFSKEFALLLPMVFLFSDYRLQRRRVRISSYIPFLIPITCYLTLRAVAVRNANFLTTVNLADSLAAPYLVIRYALNMILPIRLRVIYDLHPAVLTSMLSLCLIIALLAALYVFRKHVAILFSAFWFLLFLLPVINIIPLDSASLMADRYAYFSLMGFSLFLATLICMLNGRAVVVGVAILCLTYSFVDLQRNGIWKNDTEFFTRMTMDAPEKFDGFQNLGMFYYRKGEIGRSLPYLTAALSKPDIPAMFLIGSASVFWKENILGEAEKSLLMALKLEPANPEPYLMLITMYEQNGNNTLAASYRDVAERRFHDVDKRLARRGDLLCREGEVYLSRKLIVPAENVFWQSLQINPYNIPALLGMGQVYAARGEFANASRYCRKVLALDPANARAHYCLSMIYGMEGRSEEAEREMKKSR